MNSSAGATKMIIVSDAFFFTTKSSKDRPGTAPGGRTKTDTDFAISDKKTGH